MVAMTAHARHYWWFLTESVTVAALTSFCCHCLHRVTERSTADGCCCGYTEVVLCKRSQVAHS